MPTYTCTLLHTQVPQVDSNEDNDDEPSKIQEDEVSYVQTKLFGLLSRVCLDLISETTRGNACASAFYPA